MSVCVVNLVELNPESNGGLSRVAKEMSQLLLDLAQEEAGFYPVFVVGDGFASRFPAWIERNPVIVPVNPQQPDRPLVRGLNPDLIISPLFGVEPFDQIREFAHVRHIAVMPDTLALDLPQLFGGSARAQRQRSYERLRSADYIITLSDYARGQLIQHLKLAPERVIGVHLGADLDEGNRTSVKTPDLPQPYFFYPANTWPHKRHELAFQIFSRLLKDRPELHLVMTGGRVRDFGIDLPKLIAQQGIPADHFHDLGYVADAQMPLLYGNAEGLLFTSAYEGFGMPVLEAMHFGCPVICAPLTSIPEVAGEAALYVNSADPDEWAKVILRELPKQREMLIEQGKTRAKQFSWKQTRDQYRRFLLESVPDVLGKEARPTTPTVSLTMALQEIQSPAAFSAQPNFGELQGISLATAPAANLNVHLNYLDQLIRQECQSALGKLPIIGPAVRAVIRLRNMGNFWRSSNVVAREIVRRQVLLADRMKMQSPNSLGNEPISSEDAP